MLIHIIGKRTLFLVWGSLQIKLMWITHNSFHLYPYSLLRKKCVNVLKPEQNDLLALVRGESSRYNIESVVMHSDSEVTYHTRKSRSKRVPPHDGATLHSQGENEDDATTLIVYNKK